jgi:hypothetical protein
MSLSGALPARPASPRTVVIRRRLKQLLRPSFTRVLLNRDVLRRDKPVIYLIPDDKMTPEMLQALKTAERASENEAHLFLACDCKHACDKHTPPDMAAKFDAIFTLAPELISRSDRHCQRLVRERFQRADLPQMGEWSGFASNAESFADITVSQTFKMAMFF